MIRWQLYHAVADRLVKLGFIHASEFEAIKFARMQWKRRSKDASFKTYEAELIIAYEKMLSIITQDQLSKAVDSVFEEYKDQVYVYTRNLIEDLKKDGYLLFAISGSQVEIVSRISDYYGFRSFAATRYEIKNNKFTGKKDVPSLNKDIALKLLIEQYGLDLNGSIAVGDSSGDIPLLDAVENPIAFNPDEKLYRHSRQMGWKIVIERKDVIYELEDKDGTYILA